MRRLGALLVSISLTVIACTPAAPTPPPQVYDVQVDAKATSFSLAAGLYFPRDIEARPGDTIRFTAVDRGDIHTVTFGTRVDAALDAIAKVPAGATPPTLQSFDLPSPLIGSPPTDLDQAAAQPCFLGEGTKPAPDPCASDRQRQPELSGRQGFFNSGYLPGGAVFTVRLSGSLAPGTYRYLCLLHGPEMSGRIVVAGRERSVPGPEEARVRAGAEVDAVIRALQPLVERAPVGLPSATVVAGVPHPAIAHTQATVFAPVDVTARTGEPVSWGLFGVHTVSFNAPQDAVGAVLRSSGGGWTINSRAFVPEAAPARTSGPPQGPVTVDSGAWDGRGFRSSGLIASVAPRFVTYQVAFSRPGTYSYKCLLHPDMEGTVKVSD